MTDPCGPAATDSAITAIVVTPETLSGGDYGMVSQKKDTTYILYNEEIKIKMSHYSGV